MELTQVLDIVVDEIIEQRHDKQTLLVAVDGPDGAGKSMFAMNLAKHLQAKDVPVIHMTIDGFHRPRAERYVRGRNSPEGFYRDSYDYGRFKEVVIEPLQGDGNRCIQTAIHDVDTDEQLSISPVQVLPGTVLVVDGIFLHRDELFEYWNFSLFLDVDFKQTFQRMATRDNNSPDPYDDLNTRYREGQLLYFQDCNPKRRASMIIDNNDFKHPKIIKKT